MATAKSVNLVILFLTHLDIPSKQGFQLSQEMVSANRGLSLRNGINYADNVGLGIWLDALTKQNN